MARRRAGKRSEEVQTGAAAAAAAAAAASATAKSTARTRGGKAGLPFPVVFALCLACALLGYAVCMSTSRAGQQAWAGGNAGAADAATTSAAAAGAGQAASVSGGASSGMEHGGKRPGWWWRQQGEDSCDETQLRIVPTQQELAAGGISEANLAKALGTFRACGLIVLERAIPADVTAAFLKGLNDLIDPLLESRHRIRRALEFSMMNRVNLKQLWNDTRFGLSSEELFDAGKQFRERNDGRIDMMLPFAPPFNATAFTMNGFAHPILLSVLGEKARLKSLNAVTALTATDGIDFQHWHRDTGLLFPDDGTFTDSSVHNSQSGVHLPPYGINQFVALEDFTADNGPTEFILGSHMWGTDWESEESTAPDTRSRRFYVPAGSIVLMDYRTIHRGTMNSSPRPRPMAMLIYGREWWRDVVNYGVGDYGGFNTNDEQFAPDSWQGRQKTLLAQMYQEVAAARDGSNSAGASMAQKVHFYWGLVNRYARGIQRELQKRYRSIEQFNQEWDWSLFVHGQRE